jgi:hypothetical protein
MTIEISTADLRTESIHSGTGEATVFAIHYRGLSNPREEDPESIVRFAQAEV